MMVRGSRPVWAPAAALALLFQAGAGHSATPEASVKAAYLFKIASFVRWPNEIPAGADFRMCVFGRDDVADVLEQLVRGQTMNSRRIGVVRLKESQADRAAECHVLFAGGGRTSGRSLLAQTGSAPVLTITDRSKGTSGGAIEFVIRDGRVRFTIDQSQAKRRNLEFSSKLLEVALAVER